jgi:predicted transcriptional regulator
MRITWKTFSNESPAEYRERFRAAVQRGLEAVEAGDFVEPEEMTRIFDEQFGPLQPKSRRRSK